MVEESKQKKTSPNPFGKDKILDPMGQWKFPGQVTRIPSNRITMQGVPYPVKGVGSSGQEQMMYPGQDYSFPGSEYVDEYPLVKAQNGLGIDNTYVKKPLVPIPIGPANDLDIKKYLQLRKDETWGSPYEFMMNWYNNPITKAKLKNQKFFDKPMTEALNQKLFKNYWDWRTHEQDKNEKIAEDIWKDNFKKKWDFLKTLNDGTDISYENLKKTTAGFHVPKDSIIALNERWDRNEKQRKQTAVHEISHATPLDEYYINYFKTKTPNSPKFKEKEYFHKNPDEIYPRIMDLRYQMKLRPGRKVTPEMLEDYNNDSDYDLKNYYSPKELAEIMNEIAYNPKKQLIKAQNGLNFLRKEDPEMIFEHLYNTPLTKEETNKFNKWVKEESSKQGRNILMDKGAYDVQGFWKSGDWKRRDSDGHGTDTWKKPNHPTFSNQSKYHGINGFYGGNWTKDGGYQPSKQTMSLYDENYYKWMFGSEPNRREHLDLSRYKSGVNKSSILYYKNGGDISIPNLEETSWLNRYDEGGSTTAETTRPPIYTDDPNDPRLKAYNDSSYNDDRAKSFIKLMSTADKIPIEQFIKNKEALHKKYNKGVASNIEPIGHVQHAHGPKLPIYKKPVQPYIFQEQPQLKMVGNERRDIAPSFNTRISSPNIHSIARPDNKYMVSYTDEEGVGREEYFPTPELADQYMNWRRDNDMFYGTGMSRRGVFQNGGENDGVQRIKIKNNDGTYSYLRSDSKEYYDLVQSGAIDESSFNQKDTAFSLKQKPKKVTQQPITKKQEGPSFLDNLTSNFSNLYSKFRTAINEAPLDARGITIASGFSGVRPSKTTTPNTAKTNTTSKKTSVQPSSNGSIGFGLSPTPKINIQNAGLNVLGNKIKDSYNTFTKNISNKYNTFTKDVSDKYNEALEIAEGIPSQIERYIEMIQPESKEAITGKAKIQHQKQEVKKGDNVIKRDVLPYGFTILKDENGKPKIVRDVSSTNPKDSLAEFIHVFNNDVGADYIVGHKVKEVTDAGAKSKFDNVHAVAHFLKDSDILPGQKITPKTWRVGKGLKFYDFKTNTPGKTISTTGFDDPEWYRMLYKQSGDDPNRYRIRFVKNKNLTEKDKKEYQTDFTSNAYHKFSDIDWDGKGESTKYFAKSNWVPTKLRDNEGKIIHTHIPYKDKNSFSRFSGGTITYLFKDPVTGEDTGVTVTGSVNTMKKLGKDIIKMYGIKPEDLNFTYQDMGSYSAKPKARDGVLDYNQWIKYNTYNRGFSGAPLMIPIKKNGGETNNWLNKYN